MLNIKALYAFVSLLLAPAAAATAYGFFQWYNGSKDVDERMERRGRFLVMFGCIALAIFGIVAYFISMFISY